MTVDELRTNDKLQDHKISDLQGLYEKLEKRFDKLDNRLWAFMATVGGAILIDLLLRFKP